MTAMPPALTTREASAAHAMITSLETASLVCPVRTYTVCILIFNFYVLFGSSVQFYTLRLLVIQYVRYCFYERL